MIKMLIIVAGMIITWQSASSVETINVYRDYILAALLTGDWETADASLPQPT